ncbi:MAG: hypothetical protein NZR01_04215 [Bryobacteraceae bacterium]|nr:hypothetical protein [Bryobacteraceae bacterium]
MGGWLLALLAGVPAAAQTGPFRVDLPAGGPVALVQADWGDSTATPRGGALLVELHANLQLRNVSPRRIRAVSLRVVAQEVAPGGRGSVTRPGLDVAPGEAFAVRLDLRLMRPLAPQAGTLVEVALDGVLFDDLTFYGPNRMNARRTMLAWELEARRDRQMLAALLESQGEEALRARLLEVLARNPAGGMMPVQVVRGALPATNVEPGRMVQLAALRLPESPVELMGGEAVLAGQEARTARIEVANRGRIPVRFVEIGWLVAEPGGRLLPAGTLPAEIHLPPGQRSTVRQDGRVRFARPVESLTVYPALVEYENGEVWVPPASAWRQPGLREALPASGEMLRLAELYRRRGLEAVIQQIRPMR